MIRLRGVLVRQPGAVFTGATAAWLHGLDVANCDPITYSLDPADAVQVKGLRATSLPRSLFDIARRLSPIESVPLIDCALGQRLVTREGLARDFSTRAGARHVRCARAALDLADPAAESVMESRLRVLLILGGLPRPESQVPIRDAAGVIIARVDFYYPSHRLVIEYDGATHRESLVQDDRRQNSILAAGCRLLRFTAPDVLQTPSGTIRQVRAILSEPPLPHLAPSRQFTSRGLPRLAGTR